MAKHYTPSLKVNANTFVNQIMFSVNIITGFTYIHKQWATIMLKSSYDLQIEVASLSLNFQK